MGRIDKILHDARTNPADIRFADLRRLCEHHLGAPRQTGSHLVFKTP
jgi:hypothetical protein